MTARQDPLIWQRRPCPTWCERVHHHTDHLINRTCEYEPTGVPMTLSTVYPGDGDDGPLLATVNASLEWDAREVAPHVALSMPTEAEDLTLDEAEQVAEMLTAVVRLGRQALEAQS